MAPNKTLRKCSVCNVNISSRTFSQRQQQNKILLCGKCGLTFCDNCGYTDVKLCNNCIERSEENSDVIIDNGRLCIQEEP